MTADYRTRLIGFSHKLLLKNAGIAGFWSRKTLQRMQRISEIKHTYLNRFRPIVLRISSDDGSMFFGEKRGM